MELLKILQTKQQTTRKELLETGINDYEIKKLISMNVLTKQNRANYQINSNIVKELLVQELLEKTEKVTRKQLLDLGLSDYEIRKMIKNKTLFPIARGMFSTKQENETLESFNPTIIEQLQQLFSNKDITEIIKIIDESSDNDFILLSKEILKLLIKTVYPYQDKTNEQIEDIKELPIDNSKVVELKIETVVPTNIEEDTKNKKTTKIEIEVESTIKLIEENKTSNNSEDTSLQDLWDLYITNSRQNPIVAKEYLERYKNLCKKENIPFNYYELITNENRIIRLSMTEDELNKLKELSNEVKKLLAEPVSEHNKVMLQKQIKDYCKIHKNRNFYGKYYQACYEKKYKNYNKAEKIVNDILKENSENVLVLKMLCEIYFGQGKTRLCEEKSEKYLTLDSTNIPICTNLVRCYIENKKAHKINNLTERIMKNENADITRYLEEVIKILKNKIEKLKSKTYTMPHLTKIIFKQIKDLQEILEKHQEDLSKICCNNQATTDSIFDEYDLEEYIDEIYECLCNSSDNINISNIKPYIENLNISLDERMLLYISAAKLLFVNKFPRQAQNYLNIVEQTKGKSKFVTKQCQRCQRNKSLYLNQQKKF